MDVHVRTYNIICGCIDRDWLSRTQQKNAKINNNTAFVGTLSSPPARRFVVVGFFLTGMRRLRAGATSGTKARGASPTLCGSTRACASSGEIDDPSGRYYALRRYIRIMALASALVLVTHAVLQVHV